MKNLINFLSLVAIGVISITSCSKESLTFDGHEFEDRTISDREAVDFKFESAEFTWNGIDPALKGCSSTPVVASYLVGGEHLGGTIPYFNLSLKPSGFFSLSYAMHIPPAIFDCPFQNFNYVSQPPVDLVKNGIARGRYYLEFVDLDRSKNDFTGTPLSWIYLEPNNGTSIKLKVVSTEQDNDSRLTKMTVRTDDLSPVSTTLTIKN